MKIKLIEAISFAAKAHKNQTRKVDGSPYINHLIEVCNILNYVGIDDEKLLCVAVLHDAIEDTSVTCEQLAFLFGNDISEKVELLSDNKSINLQARKQEVKDRLAQGNFDYTAIKLADLISNMAAIPNSWDQSKIEQYLTQCSEILNVVQSSENKKLNTLFDIALYVLDTQSKGSEIYNELCEKASKGDLYWSAEKRIFILLNDTSTEKLTGLGIEGQINTMFQLGLLRSLQVSASPSVDITLGHSVDENFDEVSFANHLQILNAIKVEIAS